MKTAQELNNEIRSKSVCSWTRIPDWQIRVIQADAYRAGLLMAAQVCRGQVCRGQETSVRRIELAQAIEAEAAKGLP